MAITLSAEGQFFNTEKNREMGIFAKQTKGGVELNCYGVVRIGVHCDFRGSVELDNIDVKVS